VACVLDERRNLRALGKEPERTTVDHIPHEQKARRRAHGGEGKKGESRISERVEGAHLVCGFGELKGKGSQLKKALTAFGGKKNQKGSIVMLSGQKVRLGRCAKEGDTLFCIRGGRPFSSRENRPYPDYGTLEGGKKNAPFHS